MEFFLKEIRTSKGLSQEDMAAALKIKKSRYGTWERRDRMMSLEQAYNCCEVLGCTLNDLVGMGERKVNDDELALVECYRSTTPRGKNAIMVTAEAFRDGGLAKNNQVSGNAEIVSL